MKVFADVCPLCEGTGWKSVSIDAERRVARCDCRLQARTGALLTAARIPKVYEHCELSEFDTRFHPSLAPALLAATKFVEEYPLEKAGLLLVGTLGVGKTHLAIGMVKALILKKGIPCLFCDYRELLKQIQNSYNDSVKVTELEVLRPVFDAEVLVLDELGVVKPTDWVWDTVSLILNTRYNDKRTTLITTNYPNAPAALARASDKPAREESLGDRIGERMRSRLAEMCVEVEMRGNDLRQSVKKARFG